MRRRCSWGVLGTTVFSFWLLFAVLGVFSCLTLLDGPAATAAENPADDELGGGGGGAPAGGGGGQPAASAPQQGGESVLVWMFKSMGWFYSIVFICLSFTLVALFVMNILGARRDNVVPAALVEGFEAQLNEKRYQEAYEMAKNDESFLGQVLSAGLAKLSAGYDQAIEAMQEVGEEENMKLEHRLSYMALIGTISPMVGLMGTVQGMIGSFKVLANTAGGAPDPSLLAGGISKALFTTLVGLFIALPAIAAFNILRNRVARLVLEVGILSEGLMSRFANVGAAGSQPKKS